MTRNLRGRLSRLESATRPVEEDPNEMVLHGPDVSNPDTENAYRWLASIAVFGDDVTKENRERAVQERYEELIKPKMVPRHTLERKELSPEAQAYLDRIKVLPPRVAK